MHTQKLCIMQVYLILRDDRNDEPMGPSEYHYTTELREDLRYLTDDVLEDRTGQNQRLQAAK